MRSGEKWSKVEPFFIHFPTLKVKNARKEARVMPFVGEYNHSLDSKNRIFIPAKLREGLGETFYITRKMNKTCLAVYSEAEMALLAEKLNAFPDSEVAEIKEFLFSKSILVTPDANGRVVILPSMLTYAGIEKNAVIIGAGNHLQIWAEDAWMAEERSRDMASIRKKLASIGL
jgi:MraZ protein